MQKTKYRLAVVGVISRGSNVLLVQKKALPAKELAGKWVFPGGDLRSCEGVDDALEKILLHDLHLKVEVGEIIATGNHHRRSGEKMEFINTVWLQAVPQRDSKIEVKEKWQAVRWVARKEVLVHLSESTRRWLPYGVQTYLLA